MMKPEKFRFVARSQSIKIQGNAEAAPKHQQANSWLVGWLVFCFQSSNDELGQRGEERR